MPNSQIDLSVFDDLRRMSGADFIGELVDTFLEDAPKLIQQMRSAVQAKDADAFRRAAHSLKSNSATFGATGLSELARELETLGRDNKLEAIGSRVEALQKTYTAVAAELKDLRA